MEALCCHPLAKGPSAVAGGGAGAWVWPEAMAAHVGGSHPVAAMVFVFFFPLWFAQRRLRLGAPEMLGSGR